MNTELGLRERKKQRTRETIARAAREAFAERGYHNTTLPEIAEAADVSTRTIFAYFPSKEDILFSDFPVMKEALAQALAERPKGEDALETVRKFILSLHEYKRDDLDEKMRLCIESDETLRSHLRARLASLEELIAPAIAKDLDAAEDDLRPQVVAASLTAAFNVLTERGEGPRGKPKTEDDVAAQIDPIPSHEGYNDMEDFIQRVRNPQARHLLERAIAGRGAFRRFKDTLLDFPELREAWFRFHDTRVERRAITWLVDEKLVDQAVAEREIAERPDPELIDLSGPFDPHQIAREVGQDLRGLYGDRLNPVLVFGSWARADAHPDSDIDLLVVLDRVDSVWDELRRMDPVLWRHSFDNDTVVTALPVASGDVEAGKRPVLVRARTEGLPVG